MGETELLRLAPFKRLILCALAHTWRFPPPHSCRWVARPLKMAINPPKRKGCEFSFIGLSADETEQYDARRARIVELVGELRLLGAVA